MDAIRLTLRQSTCGRPEQLAFQLRRWLATSVSSDMGIECLSRMAIRCAAETISES
jgi:hypothetical protein